MQSYEEINDYPNKQRLISLAIDIIFCKNARFRKAGACMGEERSLPL
jgi:hypothetical protein